MRLDPNHHQAYYRLGLIHRQLKNYSQAVLALEETLRIKPNQPQAHFQLARSYQAMKQFPQAIRV